MDSRSDFSKCIFGRKYQHHAFRIIRQFLAVGMCIQGGALNQDKIIDAA